MYVSPRLVLNTPAGAYKEEFSELYPNNMGTYEGIGLLPSIVRPEPFGHIRHPIREVLVSFARRAEALAKRIVFFIFRSLHVRLMSHSGEGRRVGYVG
jgi:hypothetical protein